MALVRLYLLSCLSNSSLLSLFLCLHGLQNIGGAFHCESPAYILEAGLWSMVVLSSTPKRGRLKEHDPPQVVLMLTTMQLKCSNDVFPVVQENIFKKDKRKRCLLL